MHTRRVRTVLKILLKGMLGLLLVLLLAICSISISGKLQSKLGSLVLNKINEEKGLNISVGSVAIKFPASIEINNIFIPDNEKDTLFSSEQIKLKIRILPALLKKEYEFKSFQSNCTRIKIYRSSDTSDLNLQQFIASFSNVSETKKSGKNKDDIIFDIRNIILLDTHFSYYTKDSKDSIGIYSDGIHIKTKSTDLQDNKFQLSKLKIINSNIYIQRGSKKKSNTKESVSPGNWEFMAQRIQLTNNQITYKSLHSADTLNYFDHKNFTISHISSTLADIHLKREYIKGTIRDLSLKENKGLYIKNLSSEVTLDSAAININQFCLSTPESRVNSNIHASTNIFSKKQWLQSLTTFSVEISESKLSANDVKYLPEISNSEIINLLTDDESIEFEAILKGNTEQAEFRLSLENKSLYELLAKGQVVGILNGEKRFLDVSEIRCFASSAYSNNLINSLAHTDAFSLPADLALSGNLELHPDSLLSAISMNSGRDKIELQVSLTGMNEDSPAWGLNLESTKLDPENYFLNHSNLHIRDIDLASMITGTGFNPKELTGKGSIILSSITVNDLLYENIALNFSYRDMQLEADLNSSDKNYMGTIKGDIILNKKRPQFEALADISYLNLNKLFKDTTDLQFDGIASLHLKGRGLEEINALITIDSSKIYMNKKELSIEHVIAEGYSDSTSSYLMLNSDIVAGSFQGSMPVYEIPVTLSNTVNRYLHPYDTITVSGNRKDYTFDLRIPKDDWFRYSISKEIPAFSDLHIMSSYRSSDSTGISSIRSSSLNYQEFSTESVRFELNTLPDSAIFSIRTDTISYKMNSFNKLELDGKIDRQDISSFLRLYGKNEEVLLGIDSRLSIIDSTSWSLSLFEKGLILDNTYWTVNPGNHILFEKRSIQTSNFILSNDEQYIKIYGVNTDIPGHPVQFSLENFDLSSVLKIINQNADDLSGKLNARIALNYRQKVLDSIAAAIELEELKYDKQQIGSIDIKAKSLNEKILELNMVYSDMGNSIDAEGRVNTDEKILDLSLNVGNLNISHIYPLVKDHLSALSGNINGVASLKGEFKDPDILGVIHLNQLKFRPEYLNVPLNIDEGNIQFSRNEIKITELEILDTLGNRAELDGKAELENYRIANTEFELKSSNFLVLNTGRKDNPLFFGKVYLDSEILISGNPDKLKAIVDARTNKGSQITYILPEAPRIIEEDDLVTFVSSEQFLSTNPELSVLSKERNRSKLDLEATISLDNETAFKIILDEYTGDYLSFNGSATNMMYSIKAGNEHTLSGKYEIEKGKYHASFFEFTNRNFDITQGSTIIWTGNPTDALIDIKASYRIKASPLPLLENKELNQYPFDKSTLKKTERFNVNLNIKDQLLNPDLKFTIERSTADNQQQSDVLNSTLYKLNNNTNELNKQVFGLLIFGQFLPQDSWLVASDKNLIKDRVEEETGKYLSNYINSFAGKNIPWFDLETQVDLSSSDKPGLLTEAEIGIELSKQLFNQRLIVVVGEKVNLQNDQFSSLSTDNLGGDIKIEYLITKDGQVKLETSRRKNNKSIIDGELIENTVGISFSKKFNKRRVRK